jgi:hypothetical protein
LRSIRWSNSPISTRSGGWSAIRWHRSEARFRQEAGR